MRYSGFRKKIKSSETSDLTISTMIDTEHRFLPRKPGWCILHFKQENLPAATPSPPRTVCLESRSSSLNFLNLSRFSFAKVITMIRPRKEGYDVKVIFFLRKECTDFEPGTHPINPVSSSVCPGDFLNRILKYELKMHKSLD